MVFLILSRDAGCAREMQAIPEGRGRPVYVATSGREARRIEEKADVEMVVRDPVMAVRQ